MNFITKWKLFILNYLTKIGVHDYNTFEDNSGIEFHFTNGKRHGYLCVDVNKTITAYSKVEGSESDCESIRSNIATVSEAIDNLIWYVS